MKKGLKKLITSYILLAILLFVLSFILDWDVISTIVFLSIFFIIEFLVLKYNPERYTKEKERKHLLYLFGFGLLIIGVVFLLASIFAFLKFSEAPPTWAMALILFSLILGPVLVWYARNLNK